MIKKITIEVGKKTIDLTLEEAKELHASLAELLAEKEKVTYYPYYPYYQPTITWNDTTVKPIEYKWITVSDNGLTTSGSVQLNGNI